MKMRHQLFVIAVLSITCAVALADSTDEDLEIVSRAQWGATAPKNPASPLDEIPPAYVIISHTASGACKDQDKCAQYVRNIQNMHKTQLGWDDIGYNFLVGGDGNVYEGRGWDVVGAHTKGYNTRSLGVSFIGEFGSAEPTPEQIEAARRFLDLAIRENKLTGDYKLLGQRQVSATQSPGEKLYSIIKTWEHWSQSP